MVKREMIRIGTMSLIGFLVSLFMIRNKGSTNNGLMILIPVFFIGMFYAGKTLLKLLGMIAKVYFSCQFMSLLVNPLWGSIICILLLCLGLFAIFSFGWLLGLGKCIYCLITAYQLDKQCGVNNNEYEPW